MYRIFKYYPNISRLVLAGILIIIALFLSSIIKIPNLKEVFPFIGTILLIIVNGVMYKTENKGLNELGLNLKKTNLYFLPLGLVLGVLAVLIGYYSKSILIGDTIHLNRDVDFLNVLKHLYWILPTAAVQELICRGYIYKKLISTTNLTRANVIMSIIFISMHDVFGIGIFGAIFYSISLIIGHLVFATALLRSGTILFAIGIHWGSNVANNQLFTDDKLQSSILYLTKAVQEEPTGFNPIGILLYLFALNIGFIVLGIGVWKWKKIFVKKSIIIP
ncbi:CPBP family intramembrane glutamic endopeptidase [Flavivirga spongiicola]|uniref:CPBP family intramembrane metalloprotease n=1 Tax=Flavivirga spongiicola TaxID=421621 RepID=A0ABU7XY20_9FLAO|nr:CPBP family intramembrane glutamic endopeptidase [Flavivirga sp. MEBiC05379]MDO5980340.1 CPBP family intramembrane metalloprotease [Flavivirga sp. MEBiC05379]